jgi:hypothetical protein
MAVHAPTAIPEEVEAAERAILGLTAAVGVMAAATSAAVGDPLALVGIPTLALVALLARHHPRPAASMAVVVWLTFLTQAHGEALVVPMVMSVMCLAIAIGPARLLAWIRDDFGGRVDEGPPGDQGWIEEDRG